MGKRVSYFDRQLLRAEDFRLEQGYHIARRRGVSAGMFRSGVTVGLDVIRVDAASVRVTAGLAVDGRGREIVLDADSGTFPVDPAAPVEIWIAYAEAPSDPVSYLDADEQRFARTDEAPAIVPVPPGSVPADGIRLAVVPPGGEPEMSGRPVAGPRDGSVTAVSLADAAVTERALAADVVSSRALACDAAVQQPFERARTELCFGERLLGARRRREARAHLRAALRTFTELDARPWIDRTRRGLAAT